MSDRTTRSNERRAWRSPWVIAWIALVLAVLAVNLVMIYLSTVNNPGLVVDDYYERGKNYEETLLKRRAEDPGWQMRLIEPTGIEVGRPSVFGLEVRKSDGSLLDPDRVTLFAYRPSDSKKDFEVPMQEVAPGSFQAEVRFPLKGVWDLLVAVRSGDQEYSVPARIAAEM